MIQETQNDALKYIQGGLDKKIEHPYDGMTPQEAYEAGIRMGQQMERAKQQKDAQEILGMDGLLKKPSSIEISPISPSDIPLDKSTQIKLVDDFKNGLSEQAQMASALDGLGVDLTQRQPDGSVRMNGLEVLGASIQGTGFADGKGNFDFDGMTKLLETPVDNWTPEQVNTMKDVTGVLKNITECGVTKDGTPLKETPGGELLESFTSVAESVDDIKALQQEGLTKSGKPDPFVFLTAMRGVVDTLKTSDVVLPAKEVEYGLAANKMETLAQDGLLSQHDVERVQTSYESELETPEWTQPVFDTQQKDEPLLQKDGKGLIVNLPGNMDVHLGMTEQNKASGKLFDFVREDMDNAVPVQPGMNQYDGTSELQEYQPYSPDSFQQQGELPNMPEDVQQSTVTSKEQTVNEKASMSDRIASVEEYAEKFAREELNMQAEME